MSILEFTATEAVALSTRPNKNSLEEILEGIKEMAQAGNRKLNVEYPIDSGTGAELVSRGFTIINGDQLSKLRDNIEHTIRW